MNIYHHALGQQDEYLQWYRTLESLKINGASRQNLNKLYYKQFEGAHYSDMLNIGRRWFDSLDHASLFNLPVISAIEEHKKMGHGIALVSGSFKPCLAPILEHLGGHQLLCTNLEVVQNSLTGNITQQAIGLGKRTIIERFAEAQELQLAACYAYGDDISDLDMMESVGKPVVVASADNPLVDVARLRCWPVI